MSSPSQALFTASATASHKPSIVKGPPLASRSHTVQIFIMLTLNNILLLMCLFVLPAHLLWRKALKQHRYSETGSETLANTTIKSDSFGMNAIVEAKAESHSAIRNIITAFGILFKIPLNDQAGAKWIRHAFRSSLAALFLSQGWFVARLKGWWDEAESMEQGDREEVLKRRRIGISKRMEVSDILSTNVSLSRELRCSSRTSRCPALLYRYPLQDGIYFLYYAALLQ